jgi:hypothetical protein
LTPRGYWRRSLSSFPLQRSLHLNLPSMFRILTYFLNSYWYNRVLFSCCLFDLHTPS